MKKLLAFLMFLFFSLIVLCQNKVRTVIELKNNWYTKFYDSLNKITDNLISDDNVFYNWQKVTIPHNYDQYYGYRRMKHGNLHGYALYKNVFFIDEKHKYKRIFVFFEGVGSYAQVWINGKNAGFHSGGKTTFTLDITKYVKFGDNNILTVRADHPSNINDLPWVCGGCSDAWGFSEGSQPLGIFRPVSLIITNDLKIEPFGIHIWNDTTINKNKANVYIKTEIKNYSNKKRKFSLLINIISNDNKIVTFKKYNLELNSYQSVDFGPYDIEVLKPLLWYPHRPYLYKIKVEIYENNKIVDEDSVFYGIRKIIWPDLRKSLEKRLFINDSPVFINGTCEYEHLMGKSHSFSDLQIKARVMQILSAGFNAFRDAHQPHNLRYQKYWDSLGILWWPQFSAHIWFDNDDYKRNFKNLLVEWVKERRNCPSLFLWGLQNESILPDYFAKECVELIRQLDPTASIQRKITTCNGGYGTDWNVIQNWSGTYGGNPFNYDTELKNQLLNGEYGAWRSIDFHTEGYFNEKSSWSEDRMCHLMELKIRLAESVRDSAIGHFQWLFASHENPGRIQNGEGLREIDRLGPINYKGLFTIWGEPLDVYYLFRSIYTSKFKDPVVYIVSQTWPERWITPGFKDSILVFSNCDSVVLYNDYKNCYVGGRKRNSNNFYFQWDSIFINYGLLYAEGYIDGKVATTDMILLNHLPLPPMYNRFKKDEVSVNKPDHYINYIYRVNCGGPDFIDEYGNLWMADQPLSNESQWGSHSWSQEFNLPWNYGSQRRIFNDIKGTRDLKLFQSFRYVNENFYYYFSLPDTGMYIVELYFIEPWYGKNNLYCKDWRVFDIAINDSIVENKLDIWKETGYSSLLKKVYHIKVNKNKFLKILFPNVYSGQAIISAIAIGTVKKFSNFKQMANSEIIKNLIIKDTLLIKYIKLEKFADKGDVFFSDCSYKIVNMSPLLYGKEWLKFPFIIKGKSDSLIYLEFKDKCDVFVAIPEYYSLPEWLKSYLSTNLNLKTDFVLNNKPVSFNVYYKRFDKENKLVVNSVDCYAVFIVPVNQLYGSAVDQRPEKKYAIDSLFFENNKFEKLIIDSNDVLKPVKENAKISFIYKTGLGDGYNLRIRYKNIINEMTKINIKITDLNSQVIHDYTYFLPIKRDFQSFIIENINLNAGIYNFEITFEKSNSLYLNLISIQ